MVRNAHADDGGWNWSGTQREDFPGSLDVDMLPLTPISELHMHSSTGSPMKSFLRSLLQMSSSIPHFKVDIL
eukprot:4633112-Amphidinium_carterae.1